MRWFFCPASKRVPLSFYSLGGVIYVCVICLLGYAGVKYDIRPSSFHNRKACSRDINKLNGKCVKIISQRVVRNSENLT